MTNNPLYELGSDPARALAALHEKYGTADETQVLAAVEELLADVGVERQVIADIRGAYEASTATQHEALQGPLGLCLLMDLVTTASLHESPPAALIAGANELIQSTAVQVSIRRFYRLDSCPGLSQCDLSHAKVYKVGTTSMILDCEQCSIPRQRVILKCVLPRHFSVRAITEGARLYGERHSAELTLAPAFYDSNERAVMMEFIPGSTLAERLERDHVPVYTNDPKGERRALERALRSSDIDFLHTLGHALCDALAQLHTSDQCHLDLSPRNIIIVNDDPLQVRLVDFGRNFAIAEGVPSSLALTRASVYVEPEMIAHKREGDWRSDCYSLGIILLEAAAREPLHRETIARELWRLWSGDDPWEGAPGLARIIEDLIDAAPAQRLAFMQPAGV